MNIMRPFLSLLMMGLVLMVQAPSMAAPPPRPRPSRIRWQPPTPPPNLGDPGDRGQGGGSRGPCDVYRAASALLPSSHWGLTTNDRPTVWLNLPQGLGAEVPLVFALEDAQGKVLFKELTMAVQQEAGPVPFAFPETAPALQVNQQYRWSISIYCDAKVPDRPVVIRGGIGRSASTPKTIGLSPIDRAAIYAEQGFWYDALTTLGMAKQDGEAAIAWQELLRQAGV
jgi:hypothetical protein